MRFGRFVDLGELGAEPMLRSSYMGRVEQRRQLYGSCFGSRDGTALGSISKTTRIAKHLLGTP